MEVLNPERSQARNPLFQVMLVFQNMEQSVLELGDLTVAGVDAGSVSAKFDLQLTVVESFDDAGAAAGMAVSLTYATDLFDESTVASFAERFGRILTAAVENSAVRVGSIDVLAASERSKLFEWSTGPSDVSATKSLVAMFGDQVERTPDSVAVASDSECLTFAQLDARSSSVAERLIEIGVGRDDVVALVVPRSIEWIVGMLAVWKSGAAYGPIDPSYPQDRIDAIIADTGADARLAHSPWIWRSTSWCSMTSSSAWTLTACEWITGGTLVRGTGWGMSFRRQVRRVARSLHWSRWRVLRTRCPGIAANYLRPVAF